MCICLGDQHSVPDAGIKLVYSHIAAHTAIVSWTAPDNGGISIDKYQLQCRHHGSKLWKTKSSKISAKNFKVNVLLRSLAGGVIMICQARAHNVSV